MSDSTFHIDVSNWIAKAKRHARDALVATAEDAVTRVKELTPVKTGYLRANWTAVIAGDVMPKAGAVPDAVQALAKVQLGQTIVILNPVIYASRIEYGFVGKDSRGRTYNQQGVGMMTQTMTEMHQIARDAVIRVTSR